MSKKAVAVGLFLLALTAPAFAARTREDLPDRPHETAVERVRHVIKRVVRAFEAWPTLPKP